MGLKQGLNRQEQIKVRRGFEEDVPPEVMAKQLRTTVDVIKRFTPAKQAEADAARKKAANEAREAEAAAKEKAKTLTAALNQTTDFS
ncbi:MAG: hypothetical protein ACPKM1_15655 [Spirochaetaceae bacterium]